MAFEEGIKVFFGGDTSGLKAALGEAATALEHFNEKTDRIQHRLLSNFLGFEAIAKVREWASEAIKGAEKTREEFEKMGRPIDASTASLAAFGDALEGVKTGTVSVVGGILSFFTQAGEGMGDLINDLRGASREQVRTAEETGRAADEQEKKRAEAFKRHEKDGEKAAEVEKRGQEEEEKRVLRRMNLDGQITKLKEKDAELSKEYAAIEGDNDTARLKRAEKYLEISKNRGEIESKLADKSKASKEEDAKWEKEIVSLNDKIHQQGIDALKPAERITELQSEVVELTKEQNSTVKDSVEYKRIQVKIGEANKQIEEAQTEEVRKRKEEEKEIVKAKKIQGELAEKNAKIESDFLANLYGLKGADVTGASDATLKEVVRRNNKAKQGLNSGSAFDYGDNITLTRLNNETNRAQAELDFRNKIRFDSSFGGEAAARRNFTGDPYKFDQIFSALTKGQDVADKTLTVLNNIYDLQNRRGILTVPLKGTG